MDVSFPISDLALKEHAARLAPALEQRLVPLLGEKGLAALLKEPSIRQEVRRQIEARIGLPKSPTARLAPLLEKIAESADDSMPQAVLVQIWFRDDLVARLAKGPLPGLSLDTKTGAIEFSWSTAAIRTNRTLPLYIVLPRDTDPAKFPIIIESEFTQFRQALAEIFTLNRVLDSYQTLLATSDEYCRSLRDDGLCPDWFIRGASNLAAFEATSWLFGQTQMERAYNQYYVSARPVLRGMDIHSLLGQRPESPKERRLFDYAANTLVFGAVKERGTGIVAKIFAAAENDPKRAQENFWALASEAAGFDFESKIPKPVHLPVPEQKEPKTAPSLK